MLEWLSDPNTWISLVTLTVLEIVLGVDNIIFISILAGKLPAEQQGRARTVGLMLALVTRILLLSSIFLLTRLTKELFSFFGHGFSWKDLVMLIGGGFLIWKSVKEIHNSLEGHGHESPGDVRPKLGAIIGTIVLIDILFSLDSVITAVGLVGGGNAPHDGSAQMSAAAREAMASIQVVLPSMDALPAAVQDALGKSQAALSAIAPPAAPKTEQGTGQISIMVAAIVLSMMVMLAAAKTIGDFVNRHPTVKMLALAFLILVGFVLVADGFGHHVPKGYVYFAMAFSFVVEGLNIRIRAGRKAKPVELRSEFKQ